MSRPPLPGMSLPSHSARLTSVRDRWIIVSLREQLRMVRQELHCVQHDLEQARAERDEARRERTIAAAVQQDRDRWRR